jgi:uncharacterized membrane protein
MPAAPDATPPPPTSARAVRRPFLAPAAPADRRERANGTAHPFGAVKAQYAMRRTRAQIVADALTRMASSTTFLAVHLVGLAAWVLVNSGWAGVRAFDPYPFGLLTMILSVEAIVLTIFVLISQGRESAVAELREEITLQVNLRMEEEVTKTLQLVTGLYARLGFSVGEDAELRGMLRPLDAHEIENELVQQMEGNDERAGAVRSAVRRAAEHLRLRETAPTEGDAPAGADGPDATRGPTDPPAALRPDDARAPAE